MQVPSVRHTFSHFVSFRSLQAGILFLQNSLLSQQLNSVQSATIRHLFWTQNNLSQSLGAGSLLLAEHIDGAKGDAPGLLQSHGGNPAGLSPALEKVVSLAHTALELVGCEPEAFPSNRA